MNAKGFSLIELMVGIVVALLSSLAISNMAMMLSQQKRVTSGTSQSMDNLNIIGRSITANARMAGLGMAFGGEFFCANIDGEAGFPAPVEVRQNGATLALTIRYADTPTGIASTTLKNGIARGAYLSTSALNYHSGDVQMILTKDENNQCTTIGNAKTAAIDVPTNATAIPINAYKSISYQVLNNRLFETDNVTGQQNEIASDIVYMNVYGLVNGNWVEAKDNNYTNTNLAIQFGSTAPSALKIFLIAREQSLGSSESRNQAKCRTQDSIASSINIKTDTNEPTLVINRDALCNRYQSISLVIPLINLALGAESL